MAQDQRVKDRAAPAKSAPTLQYQTGFNNQFATEARPGALPQGPQLAAEAAARPLRRTDFRHRLHRAARREPPHLDLSHAAVGGSQALCAHRQRAYPLGAVRRRGGDAVAVALEPGSRSRQNQRIFSTV